MCTQSLLTALFYAVVWYDGRTLSSSAVPRERIAPALLTALSVFGVLRGLRTLAYRRDSGAQFGLGDVYLMAGLGLWFSFPAVLWVISGAAIAGGLFFCWQEDYAIRCSGKKTSIIVQHRLRRFCVAWRQLTTFG